MRPTAVVRVANAGVGPRFRGDDDGNNQRLLPTASVPAPALVSPPVGRGAGLPSWRLSSPALRP